MTIERRIVTNFSGGELSPRLAARIDFEKHQNGCQTLENFLLMPEGGVFYRPGFYYTASTKYADRVSLLVEFIYSDLDSYILEFGHLYIRFYRGWGQILDGAVPYEIVSPYSEDDLADLCCGPETQSADVMYICHPDYPPQKLSRMGHTSWSITDVDFTRGPFLDENDTAITITASATTGAITLTASESIFNTSHIGALWQLTYAKDAELVSGSFTSATQSSTVSVALDQTVDFVTHGTWTGTIALEVSYDAGVTWETVLQWSSVNDTNKEDSHTEEVDDAIYRWNMLAYTSGTCTYNLNSRRERVNGVVRITDATSPTVATGDVVVTLARASTPTKLWSEGAWSDYRGWPRAMTFYEQRAIYAGTSYQPVSYWASESYPGGKFQSFLAGTDDDRAFSYTLAEARQNPIKWLIGDRSLVIGTTGGNYAVGTSTDALTATNPPKPTVQDNSGVAPIMPIKTALGVLFVERGKGRVSEFVYQWENDKFVTANMTRLAEHITGSGLAGMAFQKRPERTLWAWTVDGDVISFLYLREENVVAWARHPIGGDGKVESMAVKPGKAETGNEKEDEVWASVRRTINGSTVRYVERMAPWDWGDDQEDAFFVDSGLTYDSTPTSTITGLDHLEGETVAVCADGMAQTDKTVAGGRITLDEPASVVHVGKGYTATLIPMRPAFGTLLYGSLVRTVKAAIMFYKTAAAKYGTTTANLESVPFRQAEDNMDEPPALFTGTKIVSVQEGYDRQADFIVKQDKPLPCSVLAMTMAVEANT